MEKPNISISTDGNWKAENLDLSQHHVIAYNASIDLEHGQNLSEFTDAEIVNLIAEQMTENVSGLINNDPVIANSAVNEKTKAHFDIDTDSTAGIINPINPDSQVTHHELKTRIVVDSDKPISPAQALSLAQNGIVHNFSDTVCLDVLTQIRGKNYKMNSDMEAENP